MRAIITGGGTGGHIYPALAIARGLQSRFSKVQILYVGTNRGLEADIVPKANFPFQAITVSGLQRKISLENFKVLWQAYRGYREAVGIIKTFNPDVVIGTGGYVCGPVVMAAARRGIPTLIHEQNAFPGITNRILSKFADQVTVTFEDSIRYFGNKDNITLTGLPVRPEILQAERQTALEMFKLKNDKLTLLVFGGSRGARKINQAMVETIKKYGNDERLQILHATGQAGYEEFMQELKDNGISLEHYGNIIIKPYIYNMHEALVAADMVVSRAGAATLAELTVLGLPSILIPYPYASENHQEHNARALAERGAAVLIKDSQLTGEKLIQAIKDMLQNKEKLKNMAKSSQKLGRPEALSDIIKCVEKILPRQQ
ncbi:UDP-N-acetylglucosamine--N-acetylmuramyl-(pentapeptide) pyrophosphoryl-undecaprenol N-acetylglucosamine transferase [Desulforamulus reducens MI-1]|uniref:UDP-N-acetylglucosamine--N-acetylmuramyl-(pentapeptide) pyrophosphoryl-undecaprenol N-acetylglucosamine transferase n=1 Tax=Desulforamulus reducens (strain ATCC BAA-1160 / DSM 100696 / MI-1) TaxID=349161 RepID=MURG_DESRM|nr:undecaprenyldiphospho-muramoylpentapeptide beta-N-acetylglucosaminyltransferase [Desulforamulus reducens]A4J2B1.1 RecName: Full=UDP-N-acetylglucosamine--N-acetylmuramyl-(pentapeptide) pyrophosphoryl-undecaprenol N-acetylglucosamine transferase; AltName: Full=Undecaprenyl-PP-MurNAc-pentapeptide-UDPGlcNAc GlcNAc transferase [Desulforamulus reducens MI-1]ABO49214.1 UDP-N-acetylglucosamine--N-acetylmuramyl-(pentapeptide) pyrophosphoryl-undecaprenol N-acetylglucosamine transferase [Desulforamulus r